MDILLWLAGTAVSVGLFMIGYRQTVGVKRARIDAANTDLTKLFLKRIVLEDYHPEQSEIGDLLAGKAWSLGLEPDQLVSYRQLLQNVKFQIFETDLVAPDRRQSAQEKLDGLLRQTESEDLKETLRVRDQKLRLFESTKRMTAILALSASVVGTFSASILWIEEFSFAVTEILPVAIGMVITSIGAISVLVAVVGYRDGRLHASRGIESRLAQRFSGEARQLFEEAGYEVHKPHNPKSNYDFAAVRDGKRFLVDAKLWSPHINTGEMRRRMSLLDLERGRETSDGSILIVGSYRATGDMLEETSNRRIVPIRNLAEFLSSTA